MAVVGTFPFFEDYLKAASTVFGMPLSECYAQFVEWIELVRSSHSTALCAAHRV